MEYKYISLHSFSCLSQSAAHPHSTLLLKAKHNPPKMKSTAARTVLSLLGLTTWLVTPVSAYFYCKFPSRITCPDGTVIQQHELEKVARRAKEGSIYEESASNLASGLCATIDLPYYVVSPPSSQSLKDEKIDS